ncbi:MAG: endonuclease III [Candidatus Caldatribacteriaceae bacterium]
MKEKMEAILDLLEERFPDAQLLLAFHNPFELLVATVLAAQSPDERVNEVTKVLFARFPTPQELAWAPQEEVEEIVRPLNYARKKAAFIKEISRVLVEEFQGEVPTSLEELVRLPGVGRKTANIVLANAFHVPAIPVDTHVGRVAQRIGLSSSSEPEKIEEDLMRSIPKNRWVRATHLLGFLGRFICQARKPHCMICPIIGWCAYPEKNL